MRAQRLPKRFVSFKNRAQKLDKEQAEWGERINDRSTETLESSGTVQSGFGIIKTALKGICVGDNLPFLKELMMKSSMSIGSRKSASTTKELEIMQ